MGSFVAGSAKITEEVVSELPLKAVITGIGEKLGKRMNQSAFDLHMEVGRAAILDAGLLPDAIDGVLTGTPFVEVLSFVQLGGRRDAWGAQLRFSHRCTLGGANPCAMVNLAARAVSQGWCQAVLVIYADNRLTAMSRDTAIERMTDAVHPEFERPLGPTVAALYAMAAIAPHAGLRLEARGVRTRSPSRLATTRSAPTARSCGSRSPSTTCSAPR